MSVARVVKVSPTFWGKIKNFDKKEWKNDYKKVNERLVLLVDKLASFIKKEYNAAPCIIHVAWERTGHEENSQHYLGNAVDLDFRGVPLRWQLMSAERFAFGGIGVYPFWNRPGLHLDIREVDIGARWWKDKSGEYKKFNDELWLALSRAE